MMEGIRKFHAERRPAAKPVAPESPTLISTAPIAHDVEAQILADEVGELRMQLQALQGEVDATVKAAQQLGIDPTQVMIRRSSIMPAIEAVCKHYGISLSAFFSRSRERRLSKARYIIMGILKVRGYGLAKTGRLLSMHHTSALYGSRKAAKLRATDPAFNEAYEVAEDVLRQRSFRMPPKNTHQEISARRSA